MAEVKWIKILTGMFEDEKIKLIQALPEGDALIVIWIKLICLAGKCNANGYIFISENIPYTDEMLSITLDKPLTIVRLALKTFQGFEMLNADENGHYFITNFVKHQNVTGLEKIREQGRLRVAKFRDKTKLLENQDKNENVTLPVTQCNATDKNKNKIRIEKEEEDFLKKIKNEKNLQKYDLDYYSEAVMNYYKTFKNYDDFSQKVGIFINNDKKKNDVKFAEVKKSPRKDPTEIAHRIFGSLLSRNIKFKNIDDHHKYTDEILQEYKTELQGMNQLQIQITKEHLIEYIENL